MDQVHVTRHKVLVEGQSSRSVRRRGISSCSFLTVIDELTRTRGDLKADLQGRAPRARQGCLAGGPPRGYKGGRR